MFPIDHTSVYISHYSCSVIVPRYLFIRYSKTLTLDKHLLVCPHSEIKDNFFVGIGF